jgi:CheY-like chemotaxis protein
VLLVEAEPEQAAACTQLLEREGLKVVKATTRKEGLQVAEQEQPEVVVADVTLADGSAYELAMELKHVPALAQVPVVGMTESNAGPEPAGASSLLAAQLRKPVEPELLGKAIRDLLAQRVTKRVKQRRDRRFKLES